MAEMDSVSGTANMTNETIMPCPSITGIGSLLLCIIMVIEMIVGLPGSALALWIFCFRMNSWKPHTLFLFNLVLADSLLLVSVPFRIDAYLRHGHWVFGQVWCRINLFMLTVNRSASIAFMTIVALDRYFKVVHPHHRISRVTLRQAGWFAGLMWIVVIALRIPMLATNLLHQYGNFSQCRSFDSYSVIPVEIKVHYVAFVAEFFLPWILLLFCSARIACHLRQRGLARQKRVRRAIRSVGVISVVFTICFMPSILTGLGGLYIRNSKPTDCNSYNVVTQVFMVCIGFTYLNSALDPVIYSFCSSMFQEALKSIVGIEKRKSEQPQTQLITAEKHSAHI